MVYQHIQRTGVWLVGLAALEAVVLVVLVVAGAPAVALVVALAVVSLAVLLAATFSRLRVEIDETEVRLAFGSGWPRRTVDVGAIVSARAVRNRWWYGWGIRWIPGGTLWNVWGLDAVELALASGRVLRVGTDDPAGLLAAFAGRVPVG